MFVSRRKYLLAAVILAILCWAGVLSVAQTESAVISGRITDTTGAVIPGVDLRLQSADRGTNTFAKTNEAGIYNFPSVQPGIYNLTVRKEGFRQVDFVGLTANVQAHIERNFELEVGAASVSITLQGDIVYLSTESPTVSTVVDQQFVSNMPLNGRSFQTLLMLVPGVTLSASGQPAPGQFSVNGQRTNGNYFTLDGVSANVGAGVGSSMGQTLSGSTPGWTIAGGTNGLVSVDAMQEFRVQTSTYASEFGRQPGGQISIVTKSGSNQWHGTAFDYLRNDIFDARNYFNNAEDQIGSKGPMQKKPALRQNDFGGTVSGPIWKNHTFFFYSYEGLRLRQPITLTMNYLPTPLARSKIAEVWKKLVNAQPIPMSGFSADGLTGDLTSSDSLPSTLNAHSLRLDHTLNSRTDLFLRLNHAPSSAITGGGPYWITNRSNIDTATARVIYTLASNKVNDARFNWSRTVAGQLQDVRSYAGGVVPPDKDIFPTGFSRSNSQVYGGTLGAPIVTFGVRVGAFSNNIQRQLNFVDTLSWAVGTHQFKFGFDWRRLRPSPAFTPYGVAYYADWIDLQAGTMSFCFCSRGGRTMVGMENYSSFAQDTWRASPLFTLTYGLRWEVNTAPLGLAAGAPIYPLRGVFDTSVPIGLAAAGTPVWRTRWDNFAPRIGAAFQLTPKMVLRGGFGMFYDVGTPAAFASALTTSFPYYVSGYASRVTPHVAFDLSNASLFQAPAFSLTPTGSVLGVAIDPNLKVPYTLHWNAAIERQLGPHQTVTASYIGAKGVDLLRVDALAPRNSAFYNISVNRNGDRSRYDALQIQFLRRWSTGLQATAAYTWAKSTDTASSEAGNPAGPGASQTAQTLAQLPPININKGYSDFDVRHNFTAAISYEPPVPDWGGHIGHAIMKGWAIDGVVFMHTGLPINPRMRSSVIFNGVQQTVRPDLTGQPIWLYDHNAPGGKYLNYAAFALPTNPPGNMVRNSLRNFPLSQTDLAVRRRFDITERVKLDCRVEYFNIFNHPNVALNPNNLYNPGSATTAPGPANWGWASVTQNTYFNNGGYSGNLNGSGLSSQYSVGGPRSGQLTVKISF